MSLPEPPDRTPDDARPEVPGFRNWRSIYLAVFIWFIVTVILLALFTRTFR
jgi:hypothetical protein